MSVVLMSKRELNRIDILARLESGRLTPVVAAELLRVSERPAFNSRPMNFLQELKRGRVLLGLPDPF
jgi:hypothetical protein